MPRRGHRTRVTGLDPYRTWHTTMGRPVVPEALTELLGGLPARSPRLRPVWSTENGSVEGGAVPPDGRIHDTARIDYRTDQLAAVAACVDVCGSQVRSLADHHEGARGHGRRLGLVHVGHDTLTRTPQDSHHC